MSCTRKWGIIYTFNLELSPTSRGFSTSCTRKWGIIYTFNFRIISNFKGLLLLTTARDVVPGHYQGSSVAPEYPLSGSFNFFLCLDIPISRKKQQLQVHTL